DLRDVGRLWLGESSPRTAHGRARGRAAEASDLQRRSRRHAHSDAAGCVPGRRHLRSASARGEHPRATRAGRGPSTEPPLPRPRPRSVARMSTALQFELPERLEAHEPPEARDLARDGVRLLVARKRDGRISHARFTDLPSYLLPGDVVVVNNSATLPAAL